MLLNDAKSSNLILDYDISFDNESKKEVLEILDDCFSKRKITLPYEETFLIHKDFKLKDLKCKLESRPHKSEGGLRDLRVHHYTFGEPTSKKSVIGNMDLGEEVKVSRTTIACLLSSTIAFILHHLNDEERNLFISRLNEIEKDYIKTLLDLGGYGRLSVLLNTIENIEIFLKKCQHFDESMQLEDIELLEKIRYFKMVYSYATLTPSRNYDRVYLNSIVPIDDMECEEIQNIQEGAQENTAIVKMLKLEPKRIILLSEK